MNSFVLSGFSMANDVSDVEQYQHKNDVSYPSLFDDTCAVQI